MRNIVIVISVILFVFAVTSCDNAKDKRINEEQLLSIINGWSKVLKDCDNYRMVNNTVKELKSGIEKRETMTVSIFKNPAKVKEERYISNGVAYTKENPYIQIFVEDEGEYYGYARFFSKHQYEWKRVFSKPINGVHPIEQYLVTDNYENMLNESYEKLGINLPKHTTVELIGELDIEDRNSYIVRAIQKKEDIINFIKSTHMLTEELLSKNSSLNDALMAISDKEIVFFINKETHYIEETKSTISAEEEIAMLMSSMLNANKTLNDNDLLERTKEQAGVTAIKTYYFINEAEDFDIPVIEE